MLLGLRKRMHGDYTICMGMFGNGVTIGMNLSYAAESIQEVLIQARPG